jgi:hypothetical protein
MLDDSMLLVNDTEALLTLNVNGRIITPDMTSISADLDIRCTSGNVLLGPVCGASCFELMIYMQIN